MTSSVAASRPPHVPTDPAAAPPRARRDKTHWLYLAVIVAVALGIAVGFAFPGKDGFAVKLQPLGTGFVSLIKMMITPIIFVTIVLGIGSVRKAASVGRVGGLALGYFLVMSTFALGIGLVVGNLVKPGAGLNLTATIAKSGRAQAGTGAETTTQFLLGLIPKTLISALTEGQVLQTLVVALLVGFAVQSMGARGVPVLRGFSSMQKVIFKVLAMIMWVAPIGAFGAIAAVVGATGVDALLSLGKVMVGFYVTCGLFVVVVLGTVLRVASGVSIFRLLAYLGREFLIIVSTSSSESALPRLIGKMEHLGVARPVVGVVVPTGYSFNLDGTAIYLTMASLFVAEALHKPFALGEQISLLVFMIIASKGAAGVSGAGLATLAGGLQSYRPDLLDGVGLIVGIDRFMSEARAVTNFAGNAVATVVVGSWTGQFDRDQAERVLSGQDPFGEAELAAVDDLDGGAWDGEPEDAALVGSNAMAAAGR
ncbi:MAG TPA: cation:dicarboxylase symporter family transporter [Cellulomonadaceae bacterium]|nr:cation:dicarboxylase symporter family transporter [Cellulomonadaceae bacterium]